MNAKNVPINFQMNDKKKKKITFSIVPEEFVSLSQTVLSLLNRNGKCSYFQLGSVIKIGIQLVRYHKRSGDSIRIRGRIMQADLKKVICCFFFKFFLFSFFFWR